LKKKSFKKKGESKFIKFLVSRDKNLKKMLRIARFDKSPEEFLQQTIILSFLFSFSISFVFFAISKKISFFILFVFLFFFFFFFSIFKNRPLLEIKKRRQKIDRDLLFSGQYMLVKLESGLPLFNTLIHVSKEYNETGFFFREIVQDINLGTPIEKAMAKARDYCPSENMKKILAEVVTSLKTGANVTDTLKNTLEQISTNLLLEVKAYNKKLNSIMMFYMILGTVLPSIGIALMVIFLSFAGININNSILIIVVGLLALMQLFFIAMVNNARPTINI